MMHTDEHSNLLNDVSICSNAFASDRTSAASRSGSKPSGIIFGCLIFPPSAAAVVVGFLADAWPVARTFSQ